MSGQIKMSPRIKVKMSISLQKCKSDLLLCACSERRTFVYIRSTNAFEFDQQCLDDGKIIQCISSGVMWYLYNRGVGKIVVARLIKPAAEFPQYDRSGIVWRKP